MGGSMLFIPRTRTCMDWMVLLQIISLYDSLSCSEYPPWWRIFICLRMVLLPDSPAPGGRRKSRRRRRRKKGKKRERKCEFYIVKTSIEKRYIKNGKK